MDLRDTHEGKLVKFAVLEGGYGFDACENVEFRNWRLTIDVSWSSQVTVKEMKT